MSNKNWKNNKIQFARLISEMEAMEVFTLPVVGDLYKKMDITITELYELIDRAQMEWNKAKEKA